MVLAGLEQVHIRALFSQTSAAVSLRSVALEVAGEVGGGPPASNVELCMCPANYRGDSCQVRWRGHIPPPRPPPRCLPGSSLTRWVPPSQQPCLPATGWATPLSAMSLLGPPCTQPLCVPSPPSPVRRRPPTHSRTTWWGAAHLSRGTRMASGALTSCL